MKWKKVSIHTTEEAEDLVSWQLGELGIEGVEIEDGLPISEADAKKMYIDILPELPPDDGTAVVSFYLHEAEPGERQAGNDPTAAAAPGITPGGTVDNSYTIHDRIWSPEEIRLFLKELENSLEELRACAQIGEGRIEITETEDTDWRDQWKKFFRPIRIGSILILPSWLPVPEEDLEETENGSLKVLVIDPGTAFGTGGHETTRLCIPELIREVREGSLVLDLGCGSGILGMAAAKLGAGFVTAVDIDPACEEVLRENMSANGIPPESWKAITGNVLAEDGTSEKIFQAVGGTYDLIAANILAPVIEALLAPGAADRFLKKGGVFITSGILDTKEKDVLGAAAANPAWTAPAVTREGEWVCITFRRA